jgi:hypothetical protein
LEEGQHLVVPVLPVKLLLVEVDYSEMLPDKEEVLQSVEQLNLELFLVDLMPLVEQLGKM